MTVFLSTALYSTGQESLPIKYPYAQIKKDKLEFVFSSEQEKKLREISEFKKYAYKHVDYLNLQIEKRDSVITELAAINSLHVQKEQEWKKEGTLLNSKFRVLNEKNAELQDLSNKLIIENKDLEISKNKWRNRFVGLTSIIGVATVFLILN